MSMFTLAAIALVGLGCIAALLIAVYARLPRSVAVMAEAHGRYSGLGLTERPADRLEGHHVDSAPPSLQQAA